MPLQYPLSLPTRAKLQKNHHLLAIYTALLFIHTQPPPYKASHQPYLFLYPLPLLLPRHLTPAFSCLQFKFRQTTNLNKFICAASYLKDK
ncbi:hypothetical protein V6N13_129965 [Hibiscus sabdariffa]